MALTLAGVTDVRHGSPKQRELAQTRLSVLVAIHGLDATFDNLYPGTNLRHAFN